MKTDTPLLQNSPTEPKSETAEQPYLHELLVIDPALAKPGTDRTEPLFVFDTHLMVEQAIHSLNKAGFDIKKLSLIGKGYRTDGSQVGPSSWSRHAIHPLACWRKALLLEKSVVTHIKQHTVALKLAPPTQQAPAHL